MLRSALPLLLAALAAACSGADPRSLDPARRAAAVAALAGSRAEGDWPVLLAAQADPAPAVRRAAAAALAARGGSRAVEALGLLARDVDPEVAGAAAAGLGGMPRAPRVRPLLVEAWGRAPAEARPALAAALEAAGVAPREAIEWHAARAWERDVRALDGGTPGARAGAAEELGRSGRAEAVKLLLPLAAGGDPRLAAAAARGLGHAGDPSARPVLLRLLAGGDARVVEAAAAALAELGDPGAADGLSRLATGGSERPAAAAVEALGALPNAPEVGVALCEVALRSPIPALASRAARLARQRDADCPEKPLLPRLARRGPDQLAALGVAAELRLPPDRARALAERILPLVAAPSLDPAVRAAADRALGRLGQPPGGAILGKRLAEQGNALPEAERAALLVAAARLGADGTEALARAQLTSPSEPLRAAAAEALGALGDGGRAAVGPLLADPSRAVRIAAARTLGRAGAAGAAALGPVAADARVRDPEWSAALARALGETGQASAVPALARLLEGPSAAEAAVALGRIGSAEGAAPLAAHLARPSAGGRPEAIEALALLAGPAAGAALERELWSERPEVRAAAARALGRLRDDRASEWLEGMRSDYSGEVRRAAVEALAKLPTGRGGGR